MLYNQRCNCSGLTSGKGTGAARSRLMVVVALCLGLLALVTLWLSGSSRPISFVPHVSQVRGFFRSGDSLSFPPWLQRCMAVYDASSDRMRLAEGEAERATRQWKAAQASIDDGKKEDPRHVQFQKELSAALQRHVKTAYIPVKGSPSREEVRENYPAAFAHWLTPELDRLQWLPRPVPIQCTAHAIVMIEGGQDLDTFLFSLRHNTYMLRTDPTPWALILFLAPQAVLPVVERLHIYPGGAGEHILLRVLDMELSRFTANQLVMSPDWWALVPDPIETILLLQSDVLMLKPPASDLQLWQRLVNDFVFLGGLLPQPGWYPDPTQWQQAELWGGFGHHVHTPFAGNGGCSIRQKSAHLELLRDLQCTVQGSDRMVGICEFRADFPLTAGPDYTDDEDRWLGKKLYERAAQFRGRLAQPLQQQQFAMDTIPYSDAFFTHKFWQVWQDHHFPVRDKGMKWLSKIKFYYTEV